MYSFGGIIAREICEEIEKSLFTLGSRWSSMKACMTGASNCLKYFINDDSDEMVGPIFLMSFVMPVVDRYVMSSHRNVDMFLV